MVHTVLTTSIYLISGKHADFQLHISLHLAELTGSS